MKYVCWSLRLTAILVIALTTQACGVKIVGVRISPFSTAQTVPNPCAGLEDMVPFASGDGVIEPYGICSKEQLNRVGSSATYLDKNFKLLANIDLAAFTSNSFNLIGSSATPYIGTFDGNGKVISNFSYSDAATDYIGFFRKIGTNGLVKDLGIESASVTGRTYTGILAGQVTGAVHNCHATGSLVGASYIGGLIGQFWESNASSIVKDSYYAGSVSGVGFVGGMIGWVRGTVQDSHSSGTVNASSNRNGGLIGVADQATIIRCSSSAAVTSAGYGVGGLIGAVGGTITGSYSTGSVTGTDWVGGLVGWNERNSATGAGFIQKSYSTASVSARDSVGGLSGYAYSASPISDCYARNSVAGRQWVGGLVGVNAGVLTNSYAVSSSLTASLSDVGGLQSSSVGAVNNSFWDVSTSGVTTSGVSSTMSATGGSTTTVMQTATTYSVPGWSSSTWELVDGAYPALK